MREFIDRFLRMEAASGILLIIAAIVALVMANSPLNHLYVHLFDMPVQVRIASLNIEKPLLLWVNDGLMAIFFLVIGLEVKREVLEGELSSRDKASLPIFAALGGMVVPALIFLLFNHDSPELKNGWAIPAATDIAFALGIMALLGKRVPSSLKVFLLALAIADDLGVVIIIAAFYSHGMSVVALACAGLALIGLIILNKRGCSSLTPYLLLGVILWIAVLKSGVHATIAGVLLGLTIPLRVKGHSHSPLERLEHSLHSVSGYIILPIFAFANAGINLVDAESVFHISLSLGVMLGLFIGKPLGIFLASYLAIKLKAAKLPQGTQFKQLFATSVLAGIGFTMSIFITSLAYPGMQAQIDQARLAILLGSFLAACCGYMLLRVTTHKPKTSSALEASSPVDH
ncbi:Na+/H+ antiporter NhaA [Celerinatantimonas diazotrophica]|uniref:Na(+)/H(+) antiporter NhaA n=1 Tax=Celerinatantimonas diazotrophica TaxID=412034 RepID=A0A4R1J8V4_9GAMM|nr:Na+/H+ antiporter NhaA [Celerinatantimonas diazotrophica]TCK47033.1 sodium/proton antiporter (NhaA family) [Celerinatantimonas diazotrophica]CAG9295801.1 Na(+)/H(+) antiporter NhaA [Celerinatantimonas diazotrophica]